MTTVLLLRHAEPVLPGTAGFDETTRPLTASGTAAALELAAALDDRPLAAVYSSPYRRAIATVEPLAARRGLRVEVVPEFREHVLSSEPIANWREVLTASWNDFEAAPGGGEPLRATLERGCLALERLRARHPGEGIAIGGHGTIFACILHSILPRVDCEFHLAMPMPAVYELAYAEGSWSLRSGPQISEYAGL